MFINENIGKNYGLGQRPPAVFRTRLMYCCENRGNSVETHSEFQRIRSEIDLRKALWSSIWGRVLFFFYIADGHFAISVKHESWRAFHQWFVNWNVFPPLTKVLFSPWTPLGSELECYFFLFSKGDFWIWCLPSCWPREHLNLFLDPSIQLNAFNRRWGARNSGHTERLVCPPAITGWGARDEDINLESSALCLTRNLQSKVKGVFCERWIPARKKKIHGFSSVIDTSTPGTLFSLFFCSNFFCHALFSFARNVNKVKTARRVPRRAKSAPVSPRRNTTLGLTDVTLLWAVTPSRSSLSLLTNLQFPNPRPTNLGRHYKYNK